MSSDVTQDLERTPAGAAAPGELLREARESQNLTVSDVARQLKLSVNQVEALEAGEFERLPGAVFVRGFVRNYARLMKLEPESLLQALAVRLPREEPRPAAPPSQDIPFPGAAPRRWGWYAAGAAAIVVALAVYEFFPGEDARESPTPASAAAPAAAHTPLVAQAPAGTEPAAVVPVVPADAGGAPGEAREGVTTTESVATEPAPPVDKGAARDEGEAPGPGERQVHMVFTAESWVEIRDRSGRPIFSRLNRPGTEQRVSGRPPLVVIVGNAHGVRLTYDRRPVNLSTHTRVDVARLTLE